MPSIAQARRIVAVVTPQPPDAYGRSCLAGLTGRILRLSSVILVDDGIHRAGWADGFGHQALEWGDLLVETGRANARGSWFGTVGHDKSAPAALTL